MKKRKYTAYNIEKVKKLVSKKGFICMSNKYKNMHQLLSFKCNSGHIFKKKLCIFIRSKFNCPECNPKRFTIEDIKKIAKSRGGECLSKKYNPKKMKFRCKNGHEWYASSGLIRKGLDRIKQNEQIIQ